MKTKIYEFITPSDPITFRAESDETAFVVSLFMGKGKAALCREDGVKINTMTAFSPVELRKKIYEEYLGKISPQEYFDIHTKEIAASLKSFAYGSINDRKQYDDAIKAITDPDKLAEFKKNHEDRNRTSLSKWVAYAWSKPSSLVQLFNLKEEEFKMPG